MKGVHAPDAVLGLFHVLKQRKRPMPELCSDWRRGKDVFESFTFRSRRAFELLNLSRFVFHFLKFWLFLVQRFRERIELVSQGVQLFRSDAGDFIPFP